MVLLEVHTRARRRFFFTYELRRFSPEQLSHKIKKRVSKRGEEVWRGCSSPPPLPLTFFYASIPLWEVSCRQRVNLYPQTKEKHLK